MPPAVIPSPLDGSRPAFHTAPGTTRDREMRMIFVGTSGYSFPDWGGGFYPAGIPSGQMLNFYATRFPAVEINSTYYRLPHPRVMRQVEAKTPPGFRFSVKLPGDVTHRYSRDPALFDTFLRVIEPFEEKGKFVGALAQFPWGFRDTAGNRGYLRFLREAVPDRPLFVEFRNDSWAREETFELMRDTGLGYCVVDEPRLEGLFPPIPRVTGEVAYLRFHGRNARDWWSPARGEHQRYNYLYSEEELRSWVQEIRNLEAQTRETYVFFNNCYGGHAAQNAREMASLLGLMPQVETPPAGSFDASEKAARAGPEAGMAADAARRKPADTEPRKPADATPRKGTRPDPGPDLWTGTDPEARR